MTLIETIQQNLRVLHKVLAAPTAKSKTGIYFVKGGGVYVVVNDPALPEVKLVEKIYERADHYFKDETNSLLQSQKDILDAADALLQTQINNLQEINTKKAYLTKAAADADTNPIGDDGTAIGLGQLVVVTSDTTTSLNGLYRLKSLTSGIPTWEYVGIMGDISQKADHGYATYSEAKTLKIVDDEVIRLSNNLDNQLSITGAGNDNVVAERTFPVVPGMSYRVYIKNWSLAGVTTPNPVFNISLKSNGLTIESLATINGTTNITIPPYIDINIPSNAPDKSEILFSGRVENGVTATLSILPLYPEINETHDSLENVNHELFGNPAPISGELFEPFSDGNKYVKFLKTDSRLNLPSSGSVHVKVIITDAEGEPYTGIAACSTRFTDGSVRLQFFNFGCIVGMGEFDLNLISTDAQIWFYIAGFAECNVKMYSLQKESLREYIDSKDSLQITTITGAGNDYVVAERTLPVISGKKYGIYLKNWSLAGVTTPNPVLNISISNIYGSKTFVSLVNVSHIPSYLEIDIPSEIEDNVNGELKFSGRVSLGITADILVFRLFSNYNVPTKKIFNDIPKIGQGIKIISNPNDTYCHNPTMNETNNFIFITYQSSISHYVETDRANITLIVINKQSLEIQYISLFNRQNPEIINGLSAIVYYNQSSCVLNDDEILVTTGCKINNIWHYIYKKYNAVSGESISGVCKLSYEGNVYDWNIGNYIRMSNSLYGTSFNDTYLPYTSNISSIYKYNGRYYMVSARSMDDLRSPIPYIFMESNDGIVWRPLFKTIDHRSTSETSIVIINDIVYCVNRNYNDVFYYVFDFVTGQILKESTLINTQNTKPHIANVDNVPYFVFNVPSSNPSLYWGRTKIAFAKFNSDYTYEVLWQIASSNGYNYNFLCPKKNGNIYLLTVGDSRGYNAGINNCTTDVRVEEIEMIN